METLNKKRESNDKQLCTDSKKIIFENVKDDPENLENINDYIVICPITGSMCGSNVNAENCWNNCKADSCLYVVQCEAYSKANSSPLQDSGSRREFASGAVRDIDDAKGRCDLLPLSFISKYTDDNFYICMDDVVHTGSLYSLAAAITLIIETMFNGDRMTAFLEVSQHYKDGCEKYGERNWEKGIPLHCYVDSAIRHYMKYQRGDKDERHDRACLWNLMSLYWTYENHPECNDLPLDLKNGGNNK